MSWLHTCRRFHLRLMFNRQTFCLLSALCISNNDSTEKTKCQNWLDISVQYVWLFYSWYHHCHLYSAFSYWNYYHLTNVTCLGDSYLIVLPTALASRRKNQFLQRKHLLNGQKLNACLKGKKRHVVKSIQILAEEISNNRNAKLQRTSYFVKSNLEWFQNNADKV